MKQETCGTLLNEACLLATKIYIVPNQPHSEAKNKLPLIPEIENRPKVFTGIHVKPRCPIHHRGFF